MVDDVISNQREIFSGLQLRRDFPSQQRQEAPLIMEEDYYFHTQGITIDSNGHAYYGGRVSGKKWSAFIIACIDLGCSSIFIIQEGKTFVSLLVEGDGNFLISTATCSLLLSFFWFIAGWKLLESAYLKKRIVERYQMARFWRVTNITLLLVFILTSILITLCLYEGCETGFSNDDITHILQSTAFRATFFVGVILAVIQRVVSIWVIHKYINELRRELSVDSLPLQILRT